MIKIIIFNDKDILIAELEGKVKDENKMKIAKFKEYKLLKSNTVEKLLKKMEKAIKYHK